MIFHSIIQGLPMNTTREKVNNHEPIHDKTVHNNEWKNCLTRVTKKSHQKVSGNDNLCYNKKMYLEINP